MKDYVRNTGLLINLAKAIGKIIISYKELQNVAGYTYLMHEVDSVITDIEKGNFERKILYPEKVANKGIVEYNSNRLEFSHVPIIAPNGETIIDEVNFSLEQGDHCFFDGPNGSGKTSVFRIMGELWQPYGGVIRFPGKNVISFIP